MNECRIRKDLRQNLYKNRLRSTVHVFVTAFCICCVQDKVDQLKQEVRLQYQKMQQLLEEDLGKALNVLEKSRSKFCQENSRQVLQLNERRQEAKKILSSVQVLFDKAENINFMKVRHLSFLSLNPHLLFFFSLYRSLSLALCCKSPPQTPTPTCSHSVT